MSSIVQNIGGVAIVDQFTMSTIPNGMLEIRPFTPQIPITAYVLYPSHRPLSNLGKIFIQHIEAFPFVSSPEADELEAV